jgi:hypothetical protein
VSAAEYRAAAGGDVEALVRHIRSFAHPRNAVRVFLASEWLATDRAAQRAEAEADADKCREVAAVTVKALAQLQAAVASLADNLDADTPARTREMRAIAALVHDTLSDSTALDRALDKAREQGAAAVLAAVTSQPSGYPAHVYRNAARAAHARIARGAES